MPKLRTWGASTLLVAGFSIGMAGGCDVTPPSALDVGLFVEPAEEAKPISCNSNADCNDGNSCTTDTCVTKGKNKTCQFTKLGNGAACTDNNPCTAGDTCNKQNVCISGPAQANGTLCSVGSSEGFCQTGSCALIAPVTFNTSVQTPTGGTNPEAIATGDFDGDLDLDLAVANFDSANVTVLLNNPTGTFGGPGQTTITPAGNNPNAVAVGDFNGDGKLDLAVTNGISTSNSVTVLFGNGDGTFGAPQTISVGTLPADVAAADVDGDGDPDLVVANVIGDRVTVLLNNPTGTFGGPGQTQTYSVGPNPVAVAVGDFNGDGSPDFATANSAFSSTDNVSVRLNNGDGTFGAEIPIALAPNLGFTSAAVGNLNGDTNLDLVVGNINNNTVNVLFGNGNGTFTVGPAITVGTGNSPTDVDVGDFNLDGHDDIVTANVDDDSVSVLLGNGAGLFLPPTDFPADSTGSAPVVVAVGDLNNDTKPDLATANSGTNDVSVFINTTP